ncbi:MAG: hypothetical protein IKF53_04250 [Clostridia bacterium]|nr:hypothetical protein [Clostridia bacterium]
MFKRSIILMLGLTLAVVMTVGLTPGVTASAETGFRGRIDNVNLTVDREPYIDSSSNTIDYIQFQAGVADEPAGYEVGSEQIEYTNDYKNGVAWYDETEGCYVTDPKYSGYKNKNFILTHIYRVEIVVRITGRVINESSWFKVYDDGDEWSSAVTATVNGHEATVSQYRDNSVGMCLLVSYTFPPTLPNNPYDIRIIESNIDAPRGGRIASFEATAGGYQRYYGVDDTINNSTVHHGVSWWDNTSMSYIDEGDLFITGHTYTVAIRLRVDNELYQSFYAYPKVFVNGNEAVIRKTQSPDNSTIILEYTFSEIRQAPEDYVSFQVHSLAGPIAGGKPENYPEMTVTCDNSAGSNCELVPNVSKYYYNNVCWINSSTLQPLGADEPFVKGERYSLIVPIRATGDNRFSVDHTDEGDKSGMWTTFIPEIGEEVISANCYSPHQDNSELDRLVYTRIDFGPCKAMIEDLFFTAQVPKEGETNNTSVVSGDKAKYSAKNVYWYDETAKSAMGSGEKFIANHRYSFKFEVYTNPTGSYLFPLTNGKSMNMNGKTIAGVVNDTRDGVITYKANYSSGTGPWHSFNISVDMGVCNDSVIDEVAVKIAPPVAGQTPSYNAVNIGSGYHTTEQESLREGKTEEYWHNPVTYAYYRRNGVEWYGAEPGDPAHMYETDTFVEGHRYTVVIYIDADDGYEFYHDKNNSILATATVNGEKANLRNDSYEDVYQQRITYTFVCGSAKSYKVSGSVVSTKNPTSPITVGLYKTGEVSPSYETTTYGTNAKYSFDSVSTGNYILKVTKSGYTTVSKTISVTDSDVIENIELSNDYIKGDVNNDGTITDQDAIYTLFHYFFGENYPVNQPCDFNGDGSFTDQDAIYLLFYYFFNDNYPLH